MSQNDPPAPQQPIETDRTEVSTSASTDRQFKKELILAIIEHGNRSIAILLVAVMVLIAVWILRAPLRSWLSNAQSVKVGSFEIRLREQARSQQISNELSKLQYLDDAQLQLFLIIGRFRERKSAGDFHISYSGEELNKQNLDKLQSLGLVTDVQIAPDTNQFTWKVTETGTKLHKLLLGNAIQSIRAAAALENCPGT